MGTDHHHTDKIVKTGAALLSVQGVTWITSLIGVLLLPRFLGPTAFGFLATVGATTAILTLIAAYGSTNFLIKETAREPSSTRELVAHTLMVRAILWAVLCAAALLIAISRTESASFRLVLLISLGSALFQLMTEGFLAAFQGNQRLGRMALVTSAISFAGQGLVAAVVIVGAGVVGVSFASAAMAVLACLVVGAAFFSSFPGQLRPSKVTFKRIVAAGPSYFAWDLGLKVYATVDMILLPVLVGATVAGSYAFAYKLIGIPVFATTIITMAVYPALSAAAHEDSQWFGAIVTNAARLAFIVAAPLSAGIAVLSVPIVRLLSGGEYQSSAVLVAILAIHIPPAAVHTVLGMSIFARDRQARMAVVAWVAAAFSLSVNVLAIPLADKLWNNGAIGAAVTSVATEALVGFFVWKWAWASVRHWHLLGTIARVTASCCLMGIVVGSVYAIGGLFLAVPAGGATYLAAAGLLGVFSRDELQQVRRALLTARRNTASAESIASVEA